MTPADRAAARSALDRGRSTYQRLDQIRTPEDTAADLVELWAAAEEAMRAMLGGSVLSGQALVRELRQRGSITLEQANALASFWGARSRVDDIGYKPTLTDVGYARVGYDELGRAIDNPATATAPSPFAPAAAAAGAPSPFAPPGAFGAAAPPPAAAAAAPPVAPAAAPYLAAPARGRRPATPVLLGAAAAAAILLALLAFFSLRPSGYDRALQRAVQTMQSGRPEAARAAFSQLVQSYPTRATPHVFLSRLARNEGDFNTARQELVTAIRLNPTDELAQREMGLLLLAQGNPDLARSFLVRAVKLDAADSAAQGYLGCALLRLGRVAEGQRFITRAGPGSWSGCTAAPTGATPLTAGAPGAAPQP